MYKHRQTMPSHLKRTELLELAEQYSGKRATVIITGKFTPDVLRGLFLSEEAAAKTRFKNSAKDSCLILISRELHNDNRCWTRLVIFKEAMHLFDYDLELTGNSGRFQQLVRDMYLRGPGKISPDMRGEIEALWMALGMLIPEKERAEFARLRSNGDISDSELAHKIRMPLQYVPTLFGTRYKEIISEILDRE